MPTSSPGPDRVDDAWLAEDLVWFSGSAQKEMRRQKGPLVVHFFNHQTHHRGQAHALLTACGQDTGDTDLFLVVPDAALMRQADVRLDSGVRHGRTCPVHHGRRQQ